MELYSTDIGRLRYNNGILTDEYNQVCTHEASRNQDLPVEKRRILGKNETEEKDLAKKGPKALGTLRKIVKYQFWNYVPLTQI